jgi:glycerol-3-phosphate dehydrogenase (NAD(P)+)
MEKVVVMGAGSWGTALAILLAKKGFEVLMWEYKEDRAEQLKKERTNSLFLEGVNFPENLQITSSTENILDGVEYVVFSVPSQALRGVVAKISSQLRDEITLINTAKGLELSTGMRLSEVIKDEILGKFHKNIVVLSGPTHAEEVSKELPSAIVAAGSKERSEKVQELFNTNYFRVYRSTDQIGVELGGALKNCIAVASGISDGLGYGDNSRAALIARGLTEISRFAITLGAREKTFSGLAGMGDLIVTCTSKHSRNRAFGERIGKGEKLNEILSSMHMVAEGVVAIKAVKELAQRENIDMPIVEAAYKVIYEEGNIEQILRELIQRELKEE